ncbi:DUF6318 family protein [Cellulosimicrobium protaetiae]|uniref:DUF6318 domain-containing protein n=1 Tax=Cellulosimicrobium protaetiae TaxID=2587808 RepID=A0A6M5UEH4_9MICO|nr:DUF6318 family protein [Cellulosimicrobium protaetiae]QJW36590.1 hypothetical protein FIC82_010675 [Cellulosimicrobium protaetiae]
MGAVLVVGWMVAGCTGGGEPGPSPSVDDPVVPSPAESETPEPSAAETGPVKPERPAAMDRDDAEGAAAAAKYFLELYPYVMTSSDTAEWEAMSHQECGYCSNALASATWLADNAATFVGGGTTVQVLESYGRDTETGIYPLDVASTQEAITVSGAGGEAIDNVPKSDSKFRVEVGRNSGAWVVVEVAPLPEAGA